MDNQLTYSSKFAKAFDQKHGDPVSNGDILFFADGAWREVSPMGVASEPSPDDFKRLGYVVKYHQLRLKRAVQNFDELRASIRFSGATGEDAKRHLEELKRLRDVVSERNQELEKAKAALAATPQAQLIESARQSEAERRARVEAFKSQVDTIRI